MHIIGALPVEGVVDGQVRLSCPECMKVYTIADWRPGKVYRCRKCTAVLAPKGNRPAGADAGHSSLGRESGVAVPLGGQTLTTVPGGFDRREAEALRQTVDELGVTTKTLAEHLILLEQTLEHSLPHDAGESANLTLSEICTLVRGVSDKTDRMAGTVEALSHSVQPENVEQALRQMSACIESLEIFSGQLADATEKLAAAEDESAVLAGLENRIREAIDNALPGGIGANKAAVEAMVRVAGELTEENSAASAKLEALGKELDAFSSRMRHVEDQCHMLPVQVADEIGRNIEERVVDPLSAALARQAPALISDIQDNRLVDLVSRSVREAQRPLLREILTSTRAGIPVWLFASVLLPLLLILGYLFLPGEIGYGDTAAGSTAVADSVFRLEAVGIPMLEDADARLGAIETVVKDLHKEAMAHARNAGAMEEEIRSLQSTILERDALIQEYSDTVQKQSQRLRAYEMHLARLGVSPETVPE